MQLIANIYTYAHLIIMVYVFLIAFFELIRQTEIILSVSYLNSDSISPVMNYINILNLLNKSSRTFLEIEIFKYTIYSKSIPIMRLFL